METQDTAKLSVQPSFPGIPASVPEPADPWVMMWSANGEDRIEAADREQIEGAVDRTQPGEYKNLFPIHGGWGVLSLGADGRTVWLYTGGSSFIAGDLTDRRLMRARGVPASGAVDISKLAPDIQEAILKIARAANKR